MSRRRIGVVLALGLIAAACTASSSSAPSTTSPSTKSPSRFTREQAWAEDIAYLVEHMESTHPDLYHGITAEALHVAAADLTARASALDDDQLLVGTMRLVAMVSSNGRDGHMGIWPPDNPGWFHRYSIRLWEFPDGLHVTAVAAPNEDLVGSTLRAVNELPIQEVLDRLDPVVPRDNDSNLRAARLVFLTSAEVLAGLGIARTAAEVEMTFRDAAGVETTRAFHPIDAAAYQAWVGGWELDLPERPDMLLLRDEAAPFWIRYLDRELALYVQYNHVDPSSADVAGSILEATHRHAVDRLVLDLRNNGGGEAEGYLSLLQLLVGGDFDRPGRSYVLVGRLTFSAASSFVAEIEREAEHIVLVGEPTGGAPNFWANTVTVTLPHSQLRGLVSSTYEGYGRRGDERLTIEPDIPGSMTWSDYANGSDSVLAAALTVGD